MELFEPLKSDFVLPENSVSKTSLRKNSLKMISMEVTLMTKHKKRMKTKEKEEVREKVVLEIMNSIIERIKQNSCR